MTSGFRIGIFCLALLLSARSSACPAELRRFLEAAQVSPSPLLVPETGEGLVVVEATDRFSKLQHKLSNAAEGIFLKLGAGKHRIELIAEKPGKDFLGELEARKLLGDSIFEDSIELSRWAINLAEAKLPENERNLKIISADLRFVSDSDPHSTYTHFDYYDEDYLVGIMSFEGHGLAVKPTNDPAENSATFEPLDFVLFTAISRWQWHNGITTYDEALKILKPYLDIQASKAGQRENIGRGPLGLEQKYRSKPGALPRVHHAPFLLGRRRIRISFSIVLGRAI